MTTLHQRLAAARTLLFVPGNRPDRFAKAAASGADAIVLDLEDAVPPSAKDDARSAVLAQAEAIAAFDVPVVLRINAGTAADLSDVADDIAVARNLGGLAAVMCPKADSADGLASLHAALGASIALLPLVETAAGLDAVATLAQAPGVLRLVVGHIDFMADLGMTASDDEAELLPLRFAVALATRRAGLAPAIDGVTVQTNDTARLQRDTQRALRLGFGGKLCIHPQQVAAVHAAFAPGADELDWARRVIAADAAAGGAAVQLDGRMVDAPVVLQARRLLARANG